MTEEFSHEYSPIHNSAIQQMLPQLLIALVKRVGNRLVVSVEEVDDTGQDLLAFKIDMEKREFIFEVRKKQ